MAGDVVFGLFAHLDRDGDASDLYTDGRGGVTMAVNGSTAHIPRERFADLRAALDYAGQQQDREGQVR